MSSPGIPGLKIQQTSMPSPLESQQTSATQGTLGAANAALMGTLGVSLETKAIGAAEGGATIPYDQAVSQMREQNYDPSVLPKGPIRQGTLSAIMNQQSAIARSRDVANRAPGGFAQGAAGFVGGMADPMFLLGGPALGAAGRGLGAAAEATLGAGRVASGAAAATEGVAVMGAYTGAEKIYGTAQGDRDISTMDIAKSAALGGVIGGGLGAAFHAPVTTGDIANLEGSAAAAKAQGIPENEVVSPKGAIGTYQIEPATAEAYGIPAGALKDPAMNERVAKMLLGELNKHYPGDPEAVTIAYNAGPKWANKWLAAGRDDSILPKETQGYVQRFREMHGDEARSPSESGLPTPAARETLQTAVGQFLNDEPITAGDGVEHALNESFRTNPMRIADEHEQDIQWLETRAIQDSAPKTMFQADPDIQQVARLIDMQPMTKAPTLEPETEALSQAAEKEPTEGAVAPKTAPATSVGPETKAVMPNLQHAREQAERMAGAASPEGDTEFRQLSERHTEEDAQAAEQNKALEAAVSCGVSRGLSF